MSEGARNYEYGRRTNVQWREKYGCSVKDIGRHSVSSPWGRLNVPCCVSLHSSFGSKLSKPELLLCVPTQTEAVGFVIWGLSCSICEAGQHCADGGETTVLLCWRVELERKALISHVWKVNGERAWPSGQVSAPWFLTEPWSLADASPKPLATLNKFGNQSIASKEINN